MASDLRGVTNLSALTVDSTLSVGGVVRFTSNLSASGGVNLGGSVLSLGTWGFSCTTASQMSEIADGCLGITFRASGMSLLYRSGNTIYTVGASATSAARV